MFGQSSRFARLFAGAMVASLALQLVAIAPRPAAATQLSFLDWIRGAQVAQASYGGMRATGTGTVAISGVTGPVRSAYLFWQGRTNSTSPTVNAAVSFGGASVTGVNIGVTYDNSWGFTNSQAYRADVTPTVKAALVRGAASFALANFRKADGTAISADTNGVSLIVFYDDPAKPPHDYLLWNGNDSNVLFGTDPQGWDVNFSNIVYIGGTATLTLHVGDGQDFSDGPITVNGATLVGAGSNFQGDTLPYATRENGSLAGSLWDVHSYDVASSLGSKALHVTYDTVTLSQDYLSLVVALLELPSVGPGSIALAAQPSSQFVGQQVALTATALQGTTPAALGTSVIFRSSLSDGTLGIATTDAKGVATFSYTNLVAGPENITASFTDAYGITKSASTTVSWFDLNQTIGVAQCLSQKLAPAKNPGTITATLLPNAALTFTPALPAPVAADAAGAFAITGLTPSTSYVLQYSATVQTPALGNRVVSCATSFTTSASGGALVPPSTPLPNYGNHTWLHPLPLASSVKDVVTAQFQKTWYKVGPVTPHSRVIVTLDQLSRNYTLTAYTDLAVLATKIRARSHTLAGVAMIHAQGDVSAGDLDSGDLDSGDLDSGDLDSGDLDSGDLDSGDLDSGDLDSGDLDSGDLDSGDLDSGDLDSGDLDSADLYGTAQRLGRRAFSAHGGLAPESITLNTRDYSGFIYFRVGGHSGAYDTGNTFQLTLTTPIAATDASCVGLPPTSARFLGTAPATNATTLILTNTGRLGTVLGTATPGAITGTDKSIFDSALATLAAQPEVKGAVVDLAGLAPFGAAFAEWDANAKCALEGNRVAIAVHDVIDAYRATNPNLRYIVFAGGHQAVPLFAQVDRAEISREWRFSPPLDGASAGDAALAGGYYLTDDYYATSSPIDRFGHLQFVPELMTGRLVESATDIELAITSYVNRGGAIATTNGAGNLPSLSAGYTFNSDLAAAIATELTLAGQTVDTTLNNDTWNAAQLRAKLLPSLSPTHYSVIGLQAHFSANRLVPADNTERVLSTEFVSNGNFDGSLVASIGCHLGYNIVDTYGIPTITRPRSFPEVLLSRGATLVGNTGYGYADDVLLKSSEDLILKFTHALRFSDDAAHIAYLGGTPLGQALLYAKLQYLSQPNPRGIDEKVVGEATLYGLPMSTITLPTRITRPAASVLLTTPYTGVGGLSTTTIDQSFALTRSPIGADGSSFYSVGGDLTKTLATALRPIGPAQAIDVTAKENSTGTPDTLARGWVILEGDASLVTSFVPRISFPATEDITPATANYINHAFTPVRPGALSTLSRPTFQFQPFQYFSNATGTSGTARTYSREKVQLYFSRAIDSAALAEAPLVYNVALTDLSVGTTNKVHVDVTAGYGYQAGIADLWITYTLDGGLTFRSALASLGAAAFNAGSVATCGAKCAFVQHATVDIDTLAQPTSALQFLVQAVGNNALVTSATNSGQLYSLARQNSANAPALPATQVTNVTAPGTVNYLDHMSVSATLADTNGVALSGKTIVFRFGRNVASGTTNATGLATAAIATNVPPSVGGQVVTASFASDATYSGSGGSSGPVTVNPAPTLLSPTTIQYSDSGPVGTLVLTSRGAPLVDQAVKLSANGLNAITYTDLLGRVRLDLPDFAGPLNTGTVVTLTYAGLSGRYGSSTSSFTIQPEDATVSCTCNPQPTGLVDAGLKVTEPSDGSPGDITTATVTFTNDAGVKTGPFNVQANGTVAPVSLLPGVYTITIGGNYRSAQSPLLAVFDPTTFATGGGWVLTGPTTPGGTGVLPSGKQANFGFNLKYKSGTTIPQGSLLFQLKEASIDFKATSFDWLVITNHNRAEYEGSGTINGNGAWRFRVIANDATPDAFEIRIWSAGGSFDAPTYIVSNSLGGGNNLIH